MLNERPEGKDKFGYVLIGLLVAFVIILVTSAVIWNSNHPEKVQENFEKKLKYSSTYGCSFNLCEHPS